jgi:hypothetical protein
MVRLGDPETPLQALLWEMTANTTVHLSVPEVHYAMALATQRDACKQNRDSRISKKHTGFAVHFAGVVGELCFRKVYGGKINTNILPDGDGHAPDILLQDGRRVEVKTSMFSGSDVALKFEPNELGSFTHCSLVQVTLPDSGVVFPIWSWDHIKNQLEEADYGYGKRMIFRPSAQLSH